MKAFSKIMSFVLCALMFVQLPAAANPDKYAQELYDIGIIYGTDKGFEPKKTLTRAEAIAVVVRLLGEEENATEQKYKEKFVDVPSKHWAFDYVMYSFDNEIAYGTSTNTFSPDSQIDAQQFVALILRTMGYTDVNFENTMKAAVECQLFNSAVCAELDGKEFTRGDMFYIVYRCLRSKRSDGILMADYLASKGVISQKKANELDIYNNFDSIDELIENIME